MQITATRRDQLELARGQIVYVRPHARHERRSSGTSGRAPGVRVAVELLDRRRELAAGDVGQRHVLEHRAQVRAHGDPDVLQRRGGARVLDVSRSLAAHVRERALDARMTSASVISSGGRASQ